MLKKLSYFIYAAALMLVCSCSSKMQPMLAEHFTVTPKVLEVVGSEIPVTIDGRFPKEFFNKKAVLTITPVLRYEGGEATAEPVTFQGEKVQGNNRVISYQRGGNFTIKMTFDYVPAMEKSALYLKFMVSKGNKSYVLPDVKVADGCISTSQLYKTTVSSANTAVGEDAFQRVIKQAQQANIMFLIQQTNLRSSELNTQQMTALEDSMKAVAEDVERKVLDNVEVAAYASPDGGMLLNVDVANGREENTLKFVKKQMDNAKLEGYLDSDYTAEDWEGFQELVSKSDLPDKDLILRVLSMYNEPEEREAQIKNISSVYSDLADEILPLLRRARITLNYQLIGRSDDEIMAQFAEDPSKLSLEEILYASIVSEDAAEQEKIFKTTIRLHPNDYRAYNNLGVLAYKRGDYNTAAEYFAKAASLTPSAPEVNVNLGYMSLLDGNVVDAETYMAKGLSSKVGEEALGNLYIAQGQYARATEMFGDKATNSAVLAQLLNKDYSTAKTTLEAIKTPDAYTHYLKAILGARTQNAALLYEGLKEAVKMDASLAEKAAVDLEFAKYANNESFRSILNK